jgi:hypothetical protein
MQSNLIFKMSGKDVDMFTQTPKNQFVFIAALLAFIALFSTACTLNSVEAGPISPVIDIMLTQEMFDRIPLDGGFTMNGPGEALLDRVSRVELHEGFIRYQGMMLQPDRSRVYGSFDMSLGAEQGMLKAQIVDVDIPGIELDDPRVLDANRELEYVFVHELAGSDVEVVFEQMDVTEGVLQMRIRVNIHDLPDLPIKIKID